MKAINQRTVDAKSASENQKNDGFILEITTVTLASRCVQSVPLWIQMQTVRIMAGGDGN